MSDRNAVTDAPGLVEKVLTAADECFEHYGIAKTTMEDVARAAGISRATLYRYFADRESLLTALVRRRARVNMKTARAYLKRRPTIEARIADGIVRNVRRGKHDPLMRLLVSPEQMALATKLLEGTGLANELTRELWEPVLREAQQAGEIAPEVDVVELCEWIAHLEIMFISQVEDSPEAFAWVRRMVERFVVPALTRRG
ncbi:TetR/AcrR family transcriptional regulator [Amycolatopsis sp. K13G38]|uniref:TetR/AcrR family transcriptional regulator n=1 Tax=Amycolatopsis acididurans TaxID=2724524 RepID=A0ABX1JAF2_9PSEU|nr:TetR/AcrR family transcriptional regulator [Amycolatopsis acididurans]NKQ56758.1 TetR/AcrR family transcriptional regulator [Amycolatopsis acididurans]